MKPELASYLLLVLAFAPAMAAVPVPQDEAAQPAPTEPAAVPIRSGQDLTVYLRRMPTGQSPLGELSAGARERFLASLNFNENGLAGFDVHELATGLSASQIRRVLALFGREDMTDIVDAMADPGPGHSNDAPISPIEREYNALYRLDKALVRDPSVTDQERAQRLAAEYDRLFAGLLTPAALQETDIRDLDFLHRATYLVAFYSRQPRYAADLMRILQVLGERGAATDRMYEDTLQMLVAARDFDRARELAGSPAFPGPVELPRVKDRAGNGERPTVLAFEGERWVRRPAMWNRGDRIVVVSYPGCHFTQDAIAAIEADPELSSLLADSIWLAPQDATVGFGTYREWNRAHPQAPMVVAYRAAEFPLIDYWGTPTFYFIREGKPVATVQGWPREGRKAELMAAARKLGQALHEGTSKSPVPASSFPPSRE